ncbi:MAG: GNAT family N-acetyltransferase [Myxococcales bacterium]
MGKRRHMKPSARRGEREGCVEPLFGEELVAETLASDLSAQRDTASGEPYFVRDSDGAALSLEAAGAVFDRDDRLSAEHKRRTGGSGGTKASAASDKGAATAAVRRATGADREAFLSWAREVEPLFGPMVGVPEFEAALDSAIARGDALACVEAGADTPSGGILIGREQREIGWLVIGASSRGRGAGSRLVSAALEALGPGPVSVETFASGFPEGEAARRLYERFGFEPTGKGGRTPAGIATEVLRRQ